MLWIFAIIILWILLSLDFLIELNLFTHVIFHIIVGLAGTYYIVMNRKVLFKKKKKR